MGLQRIGHNWVTNTSLLKKVNRVFGNIRFHSVVLLSLKNSTWWVGFFFVQDVLYYSFISYLSFVSPHWLSVSLNRADVGWRPEGWLLGFSPSCQLCSRPLTPEATTTLSVFSPWLDADPEPLCHYLKNLLTQKPGRSRFIVDFIVNTEEIYLKSSHHTTLASPLLLLLCCSVVPSSFATPWTVAYQAPPSMGFSRQEYWNGLPFPSPGDVPDPGIEPMSPALQADSFLLSHQRSPASSWSKFILSSVWWQSSFSAYFSPKKELFSISWIFFGAPKNVHLFILGSNESYHCKALFSELLLKE